jgi:hypothetical protein
MEGPVMHTSQHPGKVQDGARFLDVDPAPTAKRTMRAPRTATRVGEKPHTLAEQPSAPKPARFGAGF